MARGKSDYAIRMQNINKAYIDAAENVMKQFMLDTVMITMHTEFGWGPERLRRLAEKWGDIYSRHYQALNAAHPEADYLRDQLDRALREACRDKLEFTPFEERYEDLKPCVYGRKK